MYEMFSLVANNGTRLNDKRERLRFFYKWSGFFSLIIQRWETGSLLKKIAKI